MKYTKKTIKAFIYINTGIVMIISVFLLKTFFFKNAADDDIFMDNFLIIIDILMCLFMFFCEFEIGDCLVFFLIGKKTHFKMLFKTISFFSSVGWLLMLFIMHKSTNIFLCDLLILTFSVLLIISKLMYLITKSK